LPNYEHAVIDLLHPCGMFSGLGVLDTLFNVNLVVAGPPDISVEQDYRHHN